MCVIYVWHILYISYLIDSHRIFNFKPTVIIFNRKVSFLYEKICAKYQAIKYLEPIHMSRIKTLTYTYQK